MSGASVINWPAPEVFPALRPGEIHLWCAWLGPAAEEPPAPPAGLSPDEIARAATLHFAVHRHRFVRARQNLRRVLAAYLACRPETLVFNYGRLGKPALSHQAMTGGSLDLPACSLAFNQSHCGPLWLLAVARNQPVGVDLEEMRDLPDLPLMEARIFAGAELADQQARPPSQRKFEFFRRWTEREAAAKFHGLGIEDRFVPPDRIEPLDPAGDYVGCLAYAGSPAKLRRFAWDGTPGVNPSSGRVNPAPRLLSSPHRQPALSTLC